MECLFTSNPKAISLFYISKMRAEGDELEINRQEMSPAGIPTSISFIHHRTTRQAANRTAKPIIKILTDNVDNTDWPSYISSGVEFPVVNTDYNGMNYDHFWSIGYAQMLGDRLYHTKISTMERSVYLVPGYAPSEAMFIPNPAGNNETDGVIVATMTPHHDPTLEAFVVILKPETLDEIGRAYFPKNYTLSTSFHGTWLPTELIPN